ncbi:leucine-rich_repeat domain-containing protein [Hexamita inflata]|uniref:Leucine-rich repeat domain-containing protein n=1 Tax=Hexamita inflata TaxID=28002 RepID=A0AA86QG38_9EUKA|nr:leucine-rich repeat domain-containing protein [Hexamita inflata]
MYMHSYFFCFSFSDYFMRIFFLIHIYQFILLLPVGLILDPSQLQNLFVRQSGLVTNTRNHILNLFQDEQPLKSSDQRYSTIYSRMRVEQRLNISSLTIQKCLNVQFQRTPKKVLKLYVNNCELKRINGVEKMGQLNSLNLYDNQINNVEPLRGMTGLTYLRLYKNKVVNVEPLRGLTGLTDLNLEQNLVQDFSPVNSHPNRSNYCFNNQSSPSAQQTADSK